MRLTHSIDLNGKNVATNLLAYSHYVHIVHSIERTYCQLKWMNRIKCTFFENKSNASIFISYFIGRCVHLHRTNHIIVGNAQFNEMTCHFFRSLLFLINFESNFIQNANWIEIYLQWQYHTITSDNATWCLLLISQYLPIHSIIITFFRFIIAIFKFKMKTTYITLRIKYEREKLLGGKCLLSFECLF